MGDETPELPPEAEEPTQQVAEEEPTRDYKELLAELEKANIENPQQLQGKLDASAQAGRAFQMLGDERKRSEALQAEINKLKTQPQQREEWDLPESQPVDIEAAVDRSIDKAIYKREQVAQQAQQASIYAYNMITTDQNFPLVKEAWEKKIQNPVYLNQAQTGQINPIMDYQNMVVDYFKGIAKESHKTIKDLVGGKEVPAPHVETGETRSPGSATNIVSEGDGASANRQFLDKMATKTRGGYILTDEEEALVAEAVISEGLAT